MTMNDGEGLVEIRVFDGVLTTNQKSRQSEKEVVRRRIDGDLLCEVASWTGSF